MAMRNLFPVNKLMNMGTPRKDFFMSGPYGTLSGPKRASYSSKNTIFRQDWTPSHFLQFYMGPSIIWAIQDRFISKILISRIQFFQKSSFQDLNQPIYSNFHAEFESGNGLLISPIKKTFISKIQVKQIRFFIVF